MSVTMGEANARMLEELIAAWNARDLDRVMDMMTEDAVWSDPAMPAPAQGKNAIRAFANAVLFAFPDFEISLRGPVCVSLDGTSCALPWRIKATHLHPLVPGYGPTNRTACFDGVDYIQLRDNRVARVETYGDMLTAASQLLGIRLRPRSGSIAERMLIRGQRMIAAIVRLLTPNTGRPHKRP
jgi:steroid delta-isomerase-like uncharacterized protein